MSICLFLQCNLIKMLQLEVRQFPKITFLIFCLFLLFWSSVLSILLIIPLIIQYSFVPSLMLQHLFLIDHLLQCQFHLHFGDFFVFFAVLLFSKLRQIISFFLYYLVLKNPPLFFQCSFLIFLEIHFQLL